jgi:hypothetical protein
MRQFYDWQTAGGGGDVSLLVTTLKRLEISWCIIGGLAVNHWAREPMATADVDVIIAAERVEEAVKALRAADFTSKSRSSRGHEAHSSKKSEPTHVCCNGVEKDLSINLKGHSKVSVQISTEDFYANFPARSKPADIHGILMRVASREDTLRGKILAWQDSERRASKWQKDLLDIMRLVEAHPKLRKLLPMQLAKKINE